VAEFPELVQTARKFDLRDFEFISISVDELKDAPKAKAFLEKRGAGISNRLKTSLQSEGLKTTSFIFEGANLEELMKALDPDWPGGIPHTILVSTNGEVVWRHNGQIDGDELRGRILDYMGPYYRP
jgi:hypothetical protein